jgi:GNAT superfamily N-acetyltransferase
MATLAGIRIRRAEPHDASILAEMRARSHSERNPVVPPELDRFRVICERAFFRALSESWLRAWLAYDGERPIGTASLTLAATLPRVEGHASFEPDDGARLDGRVRNVFVERTYRRRGVARALMAELFAEAEREGVDRLALGTSQLGRPLYEALDFVDKNDEMIYRRKPRSAINLR